MQLPILLPYGCLFCIFFALAMSAQLPTKDMQLTLVEPGNDPAAIQESLEAKRNVNRQVADLAERVKDDTRSIQERMIALDSTADAIESFLQGSKRLMETYIQRKKRQQKLAKHIPGILLP